jgi:hypothetical protein
MKNECNTNEQFFDTVLPMLNNSIILQDVDFTGLKKYFDQSQSDIQTIELMIEACKIASSVELFKLYQCNYFPSIYKPTNLKYIKDVYIQRNQHLNNLISSLQTILLKHLQSPDDRHFIQLSNIPNYFDIFDNDGGLRYEYILQEYIDKKIPD